MAAQVDVDSDDEYSDDPITLVDFEYDRVHFGSLLKEIGDTQQDESHNWNNDNELGNDDEQFSENDRDNFTVSDCLPLSIKLVDCAKFPWYFRKYTQQIMSKLDICDLVSESDEEMNAEPTNSNNDNCIISDDIIISGFQRIHNNIVNDYQTKTSVESITPVVKKRRRRRKISSPKLRAELQRALSQKNVARIDLKRNIGLIGIKITNTKVLGQKSKELKKNETIVHEFVHAADKMLSQCGTELIPIKDNDHDVTQATLMTNKEKIRSNIPFDFANNINQHNSCFNSDKVPSNFVGYNIKPKKTFNQYHHETNLSAKFNNRIKCLKPGSISKNTLMPLSLTTHSTYHVENVIQSNNNPVKALQKTVTELLASKQNREKFATKDHETKTIDHENFTEIYDAKERQEPHSPILPCSNLNKKNKSISENTLIVNDATQVENVQTGMILKSDNWSYLTKKDKSENIVTNCDKQVKEKPNHENICSNIPETCGLNINSQTFSSSNINTTQVISNSVSSYHKESRDVPIQVALHGVSSSDKLSKIRPLTTNELNTISSNVMISHNKLQDLNTNKIEQPNMAGLPSCQGSGNDINSTNNQSNSNSNIHVQNSQATAIILRKNIANNPQNVAQPSQPMYNSLRPQILPFTPQLSQNPHYPMQQPLSHHVLKQKLKPKPANLISSNYIFDPPQKNRFYTPGNQYNSTFNRRPHSNINLGSKNASDNQKSCKILAYRSSMMSSQLPPKTLKPVNNGRVSQSNNIPKVTNSLNGGMNHGVLRKIHINPRPLQKDSSSYENMHTSSRTPVNAEPETVSSKTKMLEILETATNNLKEKDVEVSSFKIPKMPTNLDIVPEVKDRKQIVQQKGYSPPILPIPTYVKVMDQVGLDLKKHGEKIKNTVPEMNIRKKYTIRDVNTSCKRIMNNQLQQKINKETSKKISLDEYKKRIGKKHHNNMNSKSDNVSKNVFGNKNNDKGNCENNVRLPNVLNNLRENVDRFNTESDLGYDSDSTVIL